MSAELLNERSINGEVETFCRNGVTVTRHRPCSDRLLIHMLKTHDSQHKTHPALTEKALRTFETAINKFPDRCGWDTAAEQFDAPPQLPQPHKTLAPAAIRLRTRSKRPKILDESLPLPPSPAERRAAEAAAVAESERPGEPSWQGARHLERHPHPQIRSWA